MIMKSIILASNSARRKEILEKAGLKFKVVESNFDENIGQKLTPLQLVKKLSFEKARKVFQKNKDSIVIGADTIVVCEGKILGKPKDKDDAKKMLKFLSGKVHVIITGFAIFDKSLRKPIVKSQKTKVYMKKISPQEIESYAITEESMDKAGAYAIQGEAAKFIEKIEGDFYNAVGFPIKSAINELKKLGVKML